jgi:hypothetical protein
MATTLSGVARDHRRKGGRNGHARRADVHVEGLLHRRPVHLARARRRADAGVGDHQIERAAGGGLGVADRLHQAVGIGDVEVDRDHAPLGRFFSERFQLALAPRDGVHGGARPRVVQRKSAAQPARGAGDEHGPWCHAGRSTTVRARTKEVAP